MCNSILTISLFLQYFWSNKCSLGEKSDLKNPTNPIFWTVVYVLFPNVIVFKLNWKVHIWTTAEQFLLFSSDSWVSMFI